MEIKRKERKVHFVNQLVIKCLRKCDISIYRGERKEKNLKVFHPNLGLFDWDLAA